MKQIFTVGILFLMAIANGQIKGVVKSEKGELLPVVSVVEKNKMISTSTNEKGAFILNVNQKGTYDLTFRLLGFQTVQVKLEVDKFPYDYSVVMKEEHISLKEVVVGKGINHANRIIKQAIASRKENIGNWKRFTSDFYSRGVFTLKNVPKKIFGQKIDLEEEGLDKDGNGMVYLSETFSELKFEKPNKLHERIVASKVSGDNNGYSYNTAMNSNYDFYQNKVDLGSAVVSPISGDAFAYYKFKLEGTFETENRQTINKIKVIPKRDKEPVFEGYIYIVDDSWAIYAVDLTLKGYRIKEEIIDYMTIKQQFHYLNNIKSWIKVNQSLEFSAGLFGIGFIGKFSYVFSNYQFPDSFEKKTFGSEIVKIEEDSNKKEDAFWTNNRPIPLELEELKNYKKKDSIATLKKSKTYLDSIDKKKNKFGFGNILGDYTYHNSKKRLTFRSEGLLNLDKINFNTVQGWHVGTGFDLNYFGKNNLNWNLRNELEYAFSEEKLRGSLGLSLGLKQKIRLGIGIGKAVRQYGGDVVSPFLNSITSLAFKQNYLKVFEKEYVNFWLYKNIDDGIKFNMSTQFSRRNPLQNTTDFNWNKSLERNYTSNNPQNPLSDLPAFESHTFAEIDLQANFTFGNKYINRPDNKVVIRNYDYPELQINYRNVFWASNSAYKHQFLSASLTQKIDLNYFGKMNAFLEGGTFFGSKDISFIDYKHFYGNQIPLTWNNNGKTFALLPYYSHSTNDSYAQFHLKYNDEGFLINKLPLFNLLKSKMVLGYNTLMLSNQKPYQELSIGLDGLGFGKLKVFRIEYVHSIEGQTNKSGFMVGFKM